MSIVNIQTLKSQGCELWFKGSEAVANAPKAITAAGDCKQVLPFPGAGIGMFDGTGDYISADDSTDWYFGNNNFTIEFWAYQPASGSGAVISQAPTSTPRWVVYTNTDNKVYMGVIGGTSYYPASPATFTWGVWHHVAIVGIAGTIYVSVDGVFGTGVAATMPNIAGALSIGRQEYNAIGYLNANISELRISSVARYTANFTPPRRQLESDANTKLLLHFQANNATFVDSSPSPKTITAYGNATQLTSPCGSGVASFPGGTSGSGGVLTTPKVTDLTLGSSNFTFECYVYMFSYATQYLMCWANNSGNEGVQFHIAASGRAYVSGSLNGGSTNNLQLSPTDVVPLNTWTHLSLTRYGDIFTIWINGVAKGSTTLSGTVYIKAGTTNYGIGGQPVRYYGFNGYLSGINLLIGSAKYTADFTPPTTPFKPDSYTKLLLHMDGVGAAFYDASDRPGDNGFPILPDGVSVTPAGTFAVQKLKNGQNCLKFDGSTNYITISDHAVWSMFLNNFTIVGWVKFDTVAANRMIIGQYADASNSWILQWNTNNTITLIGEISNTATFSYSCPLTPVAGTWYHIAVQRSGSTCLMCINLVSQTVTVATAFTAVDTNVAATLNIGGLNSVFNLGNFKDIQLFRKALSVDQIGQIMTETYIY
jgi:hypothetical protein